MILTSCMAPSVSVDIWVDAIVQFVIIVAEVIVILEGVLGALKVSKDKSDDKKGMLLGVMKSFTPVLLIIIATIVGNERGWGKEEDCVMIMMVALSLVKNIDYRKILRVSFLSGITVVIIFFFLSMSGIVENIRGDSFGFINRTDYAAHILFLVVTFCFYYSGRLSAKGELGILAVFIVLCTIIKGKTAIACVAIVILVTMVRQYRIINGIPYQDAEEGWIRFLFRIVYFPIKLVDSINRKLSMNSPISEGLRRSIISGIRLFHEFSFLFWALVMIGLTAIYSILPEELFSRIPLIQTVGYRLILGVLGFKQFPIRLFGNVIPQHGYGGTSAPVPFYYFLDSSYVRMILQHGVVVFVLIISIMTLIQMKLKNMGMHYEMFLLAIIALDCTMEQHIIDISYNVFVLLLFARLSTCEKMGEHVFGVKKASVTEELKIPFINRKIVKAFLTGIIIIFIVFAYITSFKISNTTCWEPSNEATVIFPGSFMEFDASDKLLDKKVKIACGFMKRHKSARCIICCEKEEKSKIVEKLVGNGIDSDRLYYCETGELEEALVLSDKIIAENEWGIRRAVCSFSFQQARISMVSKRLGLPMNSIEEEKIGLLYIPNFLIEQVKVAGEMIFH